MSVSSDQPLAVELAQWLTTPVGQYVQSWEQKKIDGMVANVFGYHALQIGQPQWDLLRANRIPNRGRTHSCWGDARQNDSDVALYAEPENLPLESQSIDLLILPHVLECSNSPHQVLREVERVLVPEGRVAISGFNPWSLWGLRNRTPGMTPWLPQPSSAQVSLARLKDWFKLLSFEVDRGRYGCYAPACRSDKWLARWRFMEQAGDRWWPVCGAVYVVSAVKRRHGLRIIGPAWKTRRRTVRRETSVAVNRGAGPSGSGARRNTTG